MHARTSVGLIKALAYRPNVNAGTPAVAVLTSIRWRAMREGERRVLIIVKLDGDWGTGHGHGSTGHGKRLADPESLSSPNY
jgi:hypothetical protein